MTDVFFSYSNKDRERVRPFKVALDALGFSVFWDIETPAGKDWNAWIIENLDRARSVVVFWSANSVVSDPVRSEADRAKRAHKLIPVRLDDPFDESRLPLGHDRRQIAYVGHWRGDPSDATWKALLAEIETLATPPWVLHRIEAKEAELRTERLRRQQAEARATALEGEVAKLVGGESQDHQKLADKLDMMRQDHAEIVRGLQEMLRERVNHLQYEMRLRRDANTHIRDLEKRLRTIDSLLS